MYEWLERIQNAIGRIVAGFIESLVTFFEEFTKEACIYNLYKVVLQRGREGSTEVREERTTMIVKWS